MTSRLDAALSARGLARSRTHAATLIAEGLVTVDGRPVVKASAQVADDARIEIAATDHYVSRAAHKLIAGLDAFAVAVAGRVALDMGASTGGFTQVLRERGADPVVAVDVGHGQLAASVTSPPLTAVRPTSNCGLISSTRSASSEATVRAAGSTCESEMNDRSPVISSGRAAHKLIAGLDAFGIAVAGRVALDMGASTGGFTQVLRERGADPVIAVDVGHGQLAASVAADPGVISIEGFNVRYMTPESLAGASGIPSPPQLLTGDLSFISLSHVLPAARAVAADDADLVLLVKPQFEVGRTAVKGGLVTDAAARADAVAGVLWSAWDAGLGTCGVISSPIVGTHGNAEYIAHLRLGTGGAGGGGNPTEWLSTVNRLTGSR